MKVSSSHYTHFPPEFVIQRIKEVGTDMNDILLRGIDDITYYSSRYIYEEITNKAQKDNQVDLLEYQKKITQKDYFSLIEHLPHDFFSEYHNKTYFLTNVGKARIYHEVELSKSVGYFHINNIVERLHINLNLVKEVVKDHIDPRSGTFNIRKDTFYFTHYIQRKVRAIKKIFKKEERAKKIRNLAAQLQIDVSFVLDTLKDHLKSIAREIRKQDQI